MLALSKRARKKNVSSFCHSPLTQMVDRRLAIAQKGLDEVRQHLAGGQVADVHVLLEKIDEDLLLLRCRLRREAETAVPYPPPPHGSAD